MNSKILASVMAISLALLVASAGALAVYKDTERSRGNTITAGEMDLKIDATSVYFRDGQEHERIILDENDYGNLDLGQDSGVMINFDDVKPGDYGELEVSLHVYDNPAHVWMSVPELEDLEVSVNEPELEAGDDPMETSTVGELSSHIEVQISDLSDSEVFDGTLEQLYQADNFYLGWIENCTTYYVTLNWELPLEVGNITQSDSVVFDIEFYAEQKRNNSVQGPQ